MPPRRTRTLEVARRAEPVASSSSSRSGTGLDGKLVLIADDDKGIVARIREHLAAQRYKFIEAFDGTQVLTALRAHRPDLLLMDVEMPGLGGVEVCRIVKANQTETGFGFLPVILMTARSGKGAKVEGLELGADDYLTKPFDLLELSARVKSMLRLKALQDTVVEKNRELDRANRELDQKRQELLELSRTDGLTGLVNRRHFEERLVAEFTRSTRYRSPLSCLLLDIDHFKKLNDNWGHPFGDLVLKEVAQVTRKVLRDVDTLARYGGEELVALLPETSREEAYAAAERMRAGVASLRLPFSAPGKQTVDVRCTASIGVATYPAPGIDAQDALVSAADECLYAAKQNGRNRVQQHEH